MKTNPVFRSLAFLLCALTAATGFWASLISLMYWEDIWTDSGYYSSEAYFEDCAMMENRVRELAQLETQERSAGLTYSQQERLSALRSVLDPENTNFRYELRLDATGELISSNLGDTLLEDQVGSIRLGTFSLQTGRELHDKDELTEEEVPLGGDAYETVWTLAVWTGEEYVTFKSTEAEPGYNEYGWYFYGPERGWVSDYDSERDSRITETVYALRSGALLNMTADDYFLAGYRNYTDWHRNLPLVGVVALVSIGIFLTAFLYLGFSAGHRQGVEGISLSWVDRIPLDLYGAAAFFLVMLGISLGDSITAGLNIQIRPYRIVGLLAVSAVVAATVLGFLLTLTVRIKAHVLPRSFLSLRLCAWCWNTLMKGVFSVGRGIKAMFHTLSMNIRIALAFLVYLAINAFLAFGFYRSYDGGFYLIGLILFNGGALWLGCRWIDQWRYIRENTGRIVGGDSGVQLDTRRMYSDLREHAEQLNDLGTAIDHAVDERLKSEHFKAELITNVSHDLKTPLTSIINYVDLLKKLDIDDPKAREYLEVLDRKGQRLKKLTEDLVEASKASTGNVAVNPTRLDLVEFTQQAAAEYEDRLTAQGLKLISRMSDQPIYISADGRHMWRILDNLLGNCAKYAMEGTRVYLEVAEWDGKAGISIKNISREPLSDDPERLTERFVRGDESRTTEGSGLGLSIARSLTEVQGGTFRLSTDGDLFKATVCFPVVLALEANNSEEQI